MDLPVLHSFPLERPLPIFRPHLAALSLFNPQILILQNPSVECHGGSSTQTFALDASGNTLQIPKAAAQIISQWSRLVQVGFWNLDLHTTADDQPSSTASSHTFFLPSHANPKPLAVWWVLAPLKGEPSRARAGPRMLSDPIKSFGRTSDLRQLEDLACGHRRNHTRVEGRAVGEVEGTPGGLPTKAEHRVVDVDVSAFDRLSLRPQSFPSLSFDTLSPLSSYQYHPTSPKILQPLPLSTSSPSCLPRPSTPNHTQLSLDEPIPPSFSLLLRSDLRTKTPRHSVMKEMTLMGGKDLLLVGAGGRRRRGGVASQTRVVIYLSLLF